MKKIFFLFTFSIFLSSAFAEDTGTGIELSASKKIAKGLEATVEAEIRTQDAVSEMERWSIGAGIDYKILKWLKADAGYVLIDRYKPSYTYYTYKENGDVKNLKSVDAIWSPRHRVYFSAIGNWKLNKHWVFSLRERYQYTYEVERYAKRMNLTKNQRDDDKVVGDESEHLLRSRLQLSWGRKKCAWSPYLSVEALNSLNDGFSLDQMRYTLGTDYKINKKNSLGLSYRYKDKNNSEESKGHLITLKYNYEF